jgi:hypothetical protein
MGRDRGEQPTPDLFSTETSRDGSRSPISPIPATQISAEAPSQRHVLPKNLRTAVKHLSDGELDLLHAATLEELERRGRLPPTDQTTNRSSRTDKSLHKRQAEAATVSLTRGQVNAVRAAFKAGIKPSLIARQFGISQSDDARCWHPARSTESVDWKPCGQVDGHSAMCPHSWIEALKKLSVFCFLFSIFVICAGTRGTRHGTS